MDERLSAVTGRVYQMTMGASKMTLGLSPMTMGVYYLTKRLPKLSSETPINKELTTKIKSRADYFFIITYLLLTY
jgi:hypothetical protein